MSLACDFSNQVTSPFGRRRRLAIEAARCCWLVFVTTWYDNSFALLLSIRFLFFISSVCFLVFFVCLFRVSIAASNSPFMLAARRAHSFTNNRWETNSNKQNIERKSRWKEIKKKIIASAHEQQFHIIIKVQKPFDGFDIFLNNVSWDWCTLLYSINEKVVACSRSYECTQRHTQTQHVHTGTGRPTVKPYYFRLRTICGYSTYSLRSRRRLSHTHKHTHPELMAHAFTSKLRWKPKKKLHRMHHAKIPNIHLFGSSSSAFSISSTNFSATAHFQFYRETETVRDIRFRSSAKFCVHPTYSSSMMWSLWSMFFDVILIKMLLR